MKRTAARFYGFREWKPLKDHAVDEAFEGWCIDNGIDPRQTYTTKAWAAFYEGFMNDWLDPRLNENHVSLSAIVGRANADTASPTYPTVEIIKE